MQFIDSHIHLQDYKEKNTQQIIADLQRMSFFKLVTLATTEDDFTKVAELHNSYPDLILPAFGIHPWYTASLSAGWEKSLQDMLEKYPQSIIGECGLDRIKGGDINRQKEVLRFHLILAEKLHRPLSLHLLKAEDVWAEMSKGLKVKFVLHSFSGSSQFLHNIIAKGAYISLNPSQQKNKNFTLVAQSVPVDKLLVESDAPYQSNPKDIIGFLNVLADLRKIDVSQLSKQLINNLQEFVK